MCALLSPVVRQDVTKVNLSEASRDELVDFIRKQTAHMKKLEARCIGKSAGDPGGAPHCAL